MNELTVADALSYFDQHAIYHDGQVTLDAYMWEILRNLLVEADERTYDYTAKPAA